MPTLNKRISELPAADTDTLTGAEQFEIIWFDGSSWTNQTMTLAELFTIMTSLVGGLPTGSAYQVLMLDGSGDPAFGSNLNDGSGLTSLDIANRVLYNSIGDQVLDFSGGGVLYAGDGTGTPSIITGERLLVDSAYAESIAWALRYLKDASGNLSIDYGSREFWDSTGYLSSDYNDRLLYNDTGSVGVLNWREMRQYDLNGILCYAWAERKSFDSAGNLSLDHDLRYAYDGFGDESFSWLTGFQLYNGIAWAFNGQSPTTTDTGWHPGTFSPLKTATMTSAMTAEDAGNMVVTLIQELINKGILAN